MVFQFVFNVDIYLIKGLGFLMTPNLLSGRCYPFVLCVSQARQAELEAARQAKEKEEEEAKQAAQQAKKEKEIQKKAIKKERQKLRTTCKVMFIIPHGVTLLNSWMSCSSCFLFLHLSSQQNWNYFADNEADSVKMMEEVEKLCDRLELTRCKQQNHC